MIGSIPIRPNTVNSRFDEISFGHFLSHNRQVQVRTDWVFVGLLLTQYAALVAAAVYISPYTWIGAKSSIHAHVWLAIVGGAILSVFPTFLVAISPGATINRYVIGVSQVLVSSLLIHLTGGRLETHFHVFGSLAFLTLYRDWKVLVPATCVIAFDHAFRGNFWPESVFGVATASQWRWLEHAGWVVFEDIVLVLGCLQSQRDLWRESTQWAQLVITKEGVDEEIQMQVAKIAESQTRLRLNEEKMQRIIDTAYDGFAILNATGSIQFWSKRATQMFGWDSNEAIGQNIDKLLHSGIAPYLIELCDGEDNLQSNQLFDAMSVNKQGERLDLEVSLSISKNGGTVEIGAFLHDVTKKKAEQLQMIHLRKMESIGQLAAGIAHEINTPTQFIGDNLDFLSESFKEINGLLGEVERTLKGTENSNDDDLTCGLRSAWDLLDISYLQEQIPRAIEQSIDGNRRVGSITQAMKEFSHPGSSEPSEVFLNQVLDNTILVCRNEWKDHAQIVTSYDSAIEKIECFPNELSQTVLNLIVNAAQAIAESQKGSSDTTRRIYIRTKSLPSGVEISIEDNGPGIPENILSRIFDPFFTTKPIGKGTGQGLAIAHSAIVDKHSGKLEVRSLFGVGTTFVISIPTSLTSKMQGV